MFSKGGVGGGGGDTGHGHTVLFRCYVLAGVNHGVKDLFGIHPSFVPLLCFSLC